MIQALAVLLLAAQPATIQAPPPSSYAECTASRLRRFVGPMGVSQSWPVAEALPAELLGQLGLPLGDPGSVSDGYSQTLLVNPEKHEAFVVQQGGFAGLQKVYGPLPVAVCGSAP